MSSCGSADVCCQSDDTSGSGPCNIISSTSLQNTNDSPAEVSCRRCKDSPGLIKFRRNGVFCQACFVEHVSGMVRSNMIKCRFSRDDNFPIMVAVSGGMSSRVLLHELALWAGLVDNPNEPGRPNQCTLRVVHVDERVARNVEDEEADKAIVSLRAEVSKYGSLELQVVRLEDVFGPESDQDESNVVRLKHLLSALPDGTSRGDMISYFRSTLLRRVAAEQGIPKLALGDNASSIATRVMAAIAKGRAASIPSDIRLMYTHFDCSEASTAPSVDSDSSSPSLRPRAVTVIRPLRELVFAEIAPYAAATVGVVPDESSTTEETDNSIDSLTSSFLVGLQGEFDHTIHTVLRVADKTKDPADDALLAAAAAAQAADPTRRNRSQDKEGRGRRKGRVAATVTAQAVALAASGDTFAGAETCVVCDGPLGSVNPIGDTDSTEGCPPPSAGRGCMCYSCQAMMVGDTILDLMPPYARRQSTSTKDRHDAIIKECLL